MSRWRMTDKPNANGKWGIRLDDRSPMYTADNIEEAKEILKYLNAFMEEGGNMDINDLFDDRKSRRYAKVRSYDVRVTLNKNGADSFVIRFGFLNKAIDAFKGKEYIQFSRVDKLPTRIYFRLFDHKENLDVHKLSFNSVSKSSNLYATITPTPEMEKIYRMKWVGKTFKIQHDDANGLYYIEQEVE